MRQKFTFGAHISEDILEEYAFGRIAEPELASVEEHLLICPSCQESLADIDEYIALMKTAVACEPRVQGPRIATPPSRRTRYAAATAAIAAGVVIAMVGPAVREKPPETVDLRSLRGAEISRIHANHPAHLRIELPDLPDGSYRIEVVDASGGTVWWGMASAASHRISAVEPKALRAGTYWVRLYSSQGELLREFGLQSS